MEELNPFKCLKCGRNCSPSKGLQCSYCYPTPVAPMYENLHPIQPEIAVPRERDVASGSRNHLVLNSMRLDSTVVEENRKGDITNDQIIKINPPNKRAKQEIYQKSDRNCDFKPGENEEKLKSSNTSETQSPVLRRDPQIYSCKSCFKDIDKHTKILPGEIHHYFCCVCGYETIKTADLQKHIDIHCPKKDCNVCSKEYTEGTLHNRQYKCRVCGKTFQCRTQLDEHSLDHVEYFKTHCWGCSLDIKDHVTRKDGKLFYFCCVCGYNTKCKTTFRTHNETHRPKIFCNTCREEYPVEQKHLHEGGFDCFLCKQKFQCRTQLEDHYRGDTSHI